MLPLWAIGVITVLVMGLFLLDFGDVVRWQIRAQNAADAAASATLVPEANRINETELLLYAATIDEMRIRYLNQAILNAITQNGCSGTAACVADYNALVPALDAAVAAYDGEVKYLKNVGDVPNWWVEEATTGAYEADIGQWPTWTAPGGYRWPRYEVCTLWGPGCTPSDAAFSFTPVDVEGGDVGVETPEVAEVAACHQVPLLWAKLLGQSTTASFRAIAVAAWTLAPQTETFAPGSTTNPATSAAYQPPEHYAPDVDSYLIVDYSGLTVNVGFVGPVPTQPYASFAPGTLYVPGTNGFTFTGPAGC